MSINFNITRTQINIGGMTGANDLTNLNSPFAIEAGVAGKIFNIDGGASVKVDDKEN